MYMYDCSFLTIPMEVNFMTFSENDGNAKWSLLLCLIHMYAMCQMTCCMQVLMVGEMFGRHLFQLPNFSADRAAAVLAQYPTLAQ